LYIISRISIIGVVTYIPRRDTVITKVAKTTDNLPEEKTAYRVNKEIKNQI
jgi:hypothetical protein